ncbi:MAG: LD-carboxypeptidase [Bacilli bacterium]|nr:LD-carboxypeptidase [Bacilli bacterium]MBR6113095.1 LD-carboxypeptidase [Bacilli bacterium]
MIPSRLEKGDKIAIVSLSLGILGEKDCRHELEIGLKRLEDFGLVPVVMPNSLKGVKYLFEHPEARAADLKEAFMNPEIKAIICAIGGDDTYKTIPYLLDDEEFVEAVKNNPKIFTGYSDTTNNHLMLNKLGLSTFYGPSFIVDLAELDNEMLPYSKKTFLRYFDGEPYEIVSSPVWYMERTDFSANAVGTPRIKKEESHGFELLNGSGVVTGKLYGGCIDSLYDDYTSERYGEENKVFEKYNLLPTLDEWKEKIFFFETSEAKMSPEKLETVLEFFKEKQILSTVKGIIIGKPSDEEYYDEYKEVYKRIFADLDTPVLYNLNFGHAHPKCLIPYDAEVTVDYDNRRVFINSQFLKERENIKMK